MSVWMGEAVLAALLVSEIRARRTLSLGDLELADSEVETTV
jgi:hypothetical protein